MTAPPSASGIPPAIDGDDDDVAWALQTAQVQWNRGAHADAIVWLERAVETAIEKGATDRAAFLNRATNALRSSLEKPNPFLTPSAEKPNPFLAPPAAAPAQNAFLNPAGNPFLNHEPGPDSSELLDAVDESDGDVEPISVPISVPHPNEASPEAPVAAAPTPTAPWPSGAPWPPTDMPAPTSPWPAPPAATPAPASPWPAQPAAPKSPFAAPPTAPAPAPARPAAPPRMPPPPKRPPPRREEAPLPAFERAESEPPPAVEERLPAFERAESEPPPAVEERLPAFERAESERPREPALPAFERAESDSAPSELPAFARADSQPPSSGGDRPLPSFGDGEPPLHEERELLPYERDSVAPPHEDESPTPLAFPASVPVSPDVEPAIERYSAPPELEDEQKAYADEGEASLQPGVAPAPLDGGEPTVVLEGVSLAEVSGLEDLPEEAQQELVRRARVETLHTDEEVKDFAVGLVLAGTALIMPEIADATCARAPRGQVVFTTGSLKAGIPLRAVAAEEGTRVAVWSTDTLEEVTADCPWVADELRQVADRYQALAGATMGVMGDRLDEALRALVTERCEVRRLLPHEILIRQGEKVGGLYIVGAGRIELCDSDAEDAEVLDELGPGDFLFAPQVLSAGTAPNVARACRLGALILFADRMTAHELMLSVPPLLEILSG